MLTIYIIKSMIEMLCIFSVIRQIFRASLRSKQWIIGLSITYLTVTVVQVNLIYYVNFNSLLSIIMLVFFTMICKMTVIERVLCVVFTFCIGLCSEGVVLSGSRYVLERPVEQITPHGTVFCLIVLLSAIIQLTFTLLVCKLVERYRKHPPSMYVSILLIISCLGVFAVEMFVTFADTKYMPAAILTILIVLFCAGLCAGVVRDQLHMQKDRLRLEFLEKQYAQQIEHYAALYAHDQDIYKVRHDMKNFIISVRTYLKQRDYESLERYFDLFTGSLDANSLTDTGNPLLDAILTAKRSSAPNIRFELNIPKLHYQKIDPMDVGMILATALDNAIEGCAGSQDQFIIVRLVQRGVALLISVENPTIKPIMIKGGQLVTQKENPNQHGYGIRGMKRIAERYHGHIQWNLEEQIFSLHILLQDF